MSDSEPAVDDIDNGPLPRTAQQEREFAAAVALRDWVRELLDGPARTEWRMHPGALDNVFVATFAKATKTYRAVLLLCDRGYGQQAGMLNRSLFEHSVVAWWLLLTVRSDDEPASEQRPRTESEVMQALRDHHAHARVLFERAHAQHPEFGELAFDGPLDEAYVAELDKRFPRFGGQWHGKRLDELVREVEDRLDEYQSLFWQLFRVVNAHNNYTLHHSSIGVASVVRWEDAEAAPTVSVGPSQDWRGADLWAALWMFGLLTVATLRRLSPERADEFASFLRDTSTAFVTLTPEQVAGVGRNDPCPCGSGRKFKRCHGPLVR